MRDVLDQVDITKIAPGVSYIKEEDRFYIKAPETGTGQWQESSRPVAKPFVADAPTLESVTAYIEETKQSITAAQAEFSRDAGKDLYGERIGQIAARLAIIEPEIARLREELKELEAKPSPEKRFCDSITKASANVMGCGRKAYSYLCERFSLKLFNFPLSKLRKDEQPFEIVKYNVSALNTFKSEHIVLNGDRAPKSPNQAESHIPRLLRNLDDIQEHLNNLHNKSEQ